MYQCLECGRRFRTAGAAEKAFLSGCPGCGGVDIDVSTSAEPTYRHVRTSDGDYGGAFDGFTVTSDADPGL